MIVYLLRKLVVLFCCCLLALSAHVHERVTGREQTVLDSKNSGTFADDGHTEESIDESLLLWKGTFISNNKQYILIKRSRFGVKLFKLSESSSGYIYRFRIYVGKDNVLQFPPGVPQPSTKFGLTERIVWFLILPILKKGHYRYVVNHYTSIPLFTALLMTRCRNMAMHLYSK